MSIDEIAKTALSPGFEKESQNSDANLAQPEAVQDSHPALLVPSFGNLEQPKEFGGRIGPDPTRYGDWEKNGRCIDF